MRLETHRCTSYIELDLFLTHSRYCRPSGEVWDAIRPDENTTVNHTRILRNRRYNNFLVFEVLDMPREEFDKLIELEVIWTGLEGAERKLVTVHVAETACADDVLAAVTQKLRIEPVAGPMR